MRALKALDQQVMVITGASSGIGLAIALAAAPRGVRLVLSARSEHSLRRIAEELSLTGEKIATVPADVGERADVERIAEVALRRFGRIDTWVNASGVSLYGRRDEVRDQKRQRVFQAHFWGLVYGCLVALPYLQENAGALINIESELTDASVPTQGLPPASTHAVKEFSDALRIEIDADKPAVSGDLDPAVPQACRQRPSLGQEPKIPSAERVAMAVLDAATHTTTDNKVGAMSVIHTTMAKIMPSLGSAMAEMQIGHKQAPRSREGTPYETGVSLRASGGTNNCSF